MIAYFNRIAKRGARAVRFQEVFAREVVSYRLDEKSLRGPVRRGEARARSVLSYGGATHDDVAGRGLEIKCCTTFAPTIPVCAAIKGVAPAEQGEHSSKRALFRYSHQLRLDPGNGSCRTFLQRESGVGQMRSNKRRRACRVRRQAWARQAERV